MAPRLFGRLRTTLAAFFRRRRADEELDEELRFHFEQMAAQQEARGLTADDARHRAQRQFGGLAQAKEACRDMRPLQSVEQFLADLRFGFRLLRRSPVFTLVAVLSLGLGIGATTAIFSVIDAIVLRQLPIQRADELHVVNTAAADSATARVSWLAFEDVRDSTRGRAEVAAATPDRTMQVAHVEPGGTVSPAETGRVQLVSGEYFTLLRQRPQAGRVLTPDDLTAAAPVAVISDGYWSRRFGRAPDVLGRVLTVNGASVTVIGVAAAGFAGTGIDRPIDLWLPATLQQSVRYRSNMTNQDGDTRSPWVPQREIAWLDLFVRVQPEARTAVGEAVTLAMRRDYTLRRGYRADDPDDRRALQGMRYTLDPAARGLSRVRAEMTAPLLILLAMVALLLALACANIAGLLLTRADGRHREMAVRLSMGAPRRRLIRQLVTESLLLACAGGALGLVLVEIGTTALMAWLGPSGGPDFSPDWRVAVVATLVSLMTGLAVGVVPALHATRVALADSLKSHARGLVSAAAARLPFGRLLIPAQLALALLLLIVAGLFSRSFQALARVDVGFRSERLLVARLDSNSGGLERASLADVHRAILDRVRALPGVASASLSLSGPFSNTRSQSSFEVEGYQRGRDERLVVQEEYVTTDYFHTLGLAIVRGRPFTDRDGPGQRRVSIVNETFVKRHLEGQDPIGRRWGFGSDFAENGFEIVGVVADARYNDLRSREGLVMAYFPAAQVPQEYLNSLEVRVAGDPGALAPALRESLRAVAPQLPVTMLETMEARLDRAVGPERTVSWLTLAFGGVALFLAALGLYGTISYAVSRRTTELGLRMALGATRGGVQWLILADAIRLVLVGLCIGLPLSWLAARALSGLLFGIAPLDAIAHGGGLLVLIAAALLAAWLPAMRASRVDPMSALRSD